MKLSDIECCVKQGSLEEAKWFSFSVNQSHGLRRTNEDKQRTVEAALRHPASNNMSNRNIARHVGVDHTMVGKWRERLSGVLLQIGEGPHKDKSMNDDEGVMDDPTEDYSEPCKHPECEKSAVDDYGDDLQCSDCDSPRCPDHLYRGEDAYLRCWTCHLAEVAALAEDAAA